MTMDKCPCVDCICVPICIHKENYSMHVTCILLGDWMSKHEKGLRRGYFRDAYSEPLDVMYRVYKREDGDYSWVRYMKGEKKWKY